MMCYSVQARDRIFVRDCGFLSFAKNMGENIGRNRSKNLSEKQSQNPLDNSKQSEADALKTT